MSGLGQYLADHANAGACASAYYNGTHSTNCPLTPGVCSVIAYLIVELKNAEYKASVSVPAVFAPVSPVPLIPVSPVTAGNDGSHLAGGSGGTTQLPWNDGTASVETRRS